MTDLPHTSRTRVTALKDAKQMLSRELISGDRKAEDAA